MLVVTLILLSGCPGWCARPYRQRHSDDPHPCANSGEGEHSTPALILPISVRPWWVYAPCLLHAPGAGGRSP
eukprot:1194336-Prorocentrum_minimum.AAC.1